MNQLRQRIKIISLFALLAVIVSVPGLLMEYQNADVLDEVVLYSVEAVNLKSEHSGDSVRVDDSIWERIDWINHAPAQVQSVGYTDFQMNDGLRLEMEEQFKLLQTMGALPKVSLSEAVSATFAKRIYMDTEQPELAVSVWVINATYQDAFLRVYMDVETSVIYDVFINANAGVSFIDRSDDAKRAFFEYLNSFGGDAAFAEKEHSIFSSYGKDKVYLGVTSTNARTRDYMNLDGSIQEYKIKE